MSDIIYDHVENIEGKRVDRVEYLEDLIIPHPKDQSQIDSIFELYRVHYDGRKQYYVIIVSSSARTVIKATPDLMQEHFPEYLKTDAQA